jgi:hypothetical protein
VVGGSGFGPLEPAYLPGKFLDAFQDLFSDIGLGGFGRVLEGVVRFFDQLFEASFRVRVGRFGAKALDC